MFSVALEDLCHVLKNDLDDIIRVIFTDFGLSVDLKTTFFLKYKECVINWQCRVLKMCIYQLGSI